MKTRPKPKSLLPAAPGQAGIWWRLGLVALAGGLAYWNSLSGPFIFDDELSIVSNRHIRELWSLATVFFGERNLPVAGRPLVNVSFAMNYAVGALDVRGYHVWNIATHLLCALALFGVVRRTLELPSLRAGIGRRSVDLAFATALIWVLHPLNSEVVDYLTQRTESMMALFYLLTLYASIRAIETPRAAMWQAFAVLFCALGMGCKESMATAPFMVILYDRIFAFESLGQAFRRRWRLYAGLAITWVELAALISHGPRTNSAGFSTDISPWTYLLNQTVMITQYLRRALWPRSLVLGYGWPLPLTLSDVMPYALLVIALVLLTAIALIRRPRLGFLGAWFFITLAPTSSIVPIATEVGAERRMYLPLVAPIVLAVVGSSLLCGFASRRRSARAERSVARATALGEILLLGTVSAALAVGTISRNREYASGLFLARTVLERWPTSWAHEFVGTQLINAGRNAEAVAHLREAARGFPRARYFLGLALFNERKLDEAIEQLESYVHEEPQRLEVVLARIAMGRAFAMQQQWPQAVEQFRRVLTMVPSHVEARRLLADALFEQAAFEEASTHYVEYLKSGPDDGRALSRLGMALVAIGKLDDAISAFRRAVDLDPGNPGTHGNLAIALLDHGDVSDAAAHAQRAVALKADDPATHALLGRALARQGKFDDARIQFERALQIDPGHLEARENLSQLLRIMSSPPRL